MSFDDLHLDGPLNMDIIIRIKLSSSIGRLRVMHDHENPQCQTVFCALLC